MDSLGVLYTFRRCPFAMRARLAVAAAGLNVEVREILLSNKPESMLRVSPKGTVPVLALSSPQEAGMNDDHVFEESWDIMLWALGQRDPLGWLASYGPEHEALVQAMDGPFKTHLDRCKYATRYEGADPEQQRALATQSLAPMERRLSDTRGLLGDEDSIIDAAIFPLVRQFAHIDLERFAAELPAMDRWRERWQQSDIFSAIMPKLEPWRPAVPPVFFSDVFVLPAVLGWDP